MASQSKIQELERQIQQIKQEEETARKLAIQSITEQNKQYAITEKAMSRQQLAKEFVKFKREVLDTFKKQHIREWQDAEQRHVDNISSEEENHKMLLKEEHKKNMTIYELVNQIVKLNEERLKQLYEYIYSHMSVFLKYLETLTESVPSSSAQFIDMNQMTIYSRVDETTMKNLKSNIDNILKLFSTYEPSNTQDVYATSVQKLYDTLTSEYNEREKIRHDMVDLKKKIKELKKIKKASVMSYDEFYKWLDGGVNLYFQEKNPDLHKRYMEFKDFWKKNGMLCENCKERLSLTEELEINNHLRPFNQHDCGQMGSCYCSKYMCVSK